MSKTKPSRNVVLLSLIMGEISLYIVYVILCGIAIFLYIDKILPLPTFIGGTMLYLFNFVRNDAWEFFQKQLSNTTA
jgi:hypothetical protein